MRSRIYTIQRGICSRDRQEGSREMGKRRSVVRYVATVLAVGVMLALLPPAQSAREAGGIASGSLGGALLASTEKPVRVYTFIEVATIAQTNSSEIIRQKVAVEQAESSKESSLNNFESQSFNYYAVPDSGISESSLYSLQDNYENALATYQDAEESMKKLKPKVAYQAQKLYLDILQMELQIQIQEKEIIRLKDEYELAKAKTAFGVYTQTQLRNAKNQWENAQDTLEGLHNTLRTNKNSMREYLNLSDNEEFVLEDPPAFGPYTTGFDENEVLRDALRNSLSLKQAQREVEELSKRVQRYESQGEYEQAQRLAASGVTRDLSLKETRQTLTRTVENTMKDYNGMEEALEKAKENLYAAQKTLVSTRLRQNVGLSTINELRQAEKAVLTAEKELLQAQYNGYLGAKKVALLKDGVLVN